MKQSGDTCVLIIEDDRNIREALEEILADEGYLVRAAKNGEQALEFCRLGPPPHLILLDLLMPVMDGFEFARRKASDPELSRVPVCVMTASGPDAPMPKAEAILRKPLEVDELIAVVKSLSRVAG